MHKKYLYVNSAAYESNFVSDRLCAEALRKKYANTTNS